ncbi:hypothetical protein E8E12_006605 [Didymella heteroderae]|uniref:Uncharacterized protein n=1 Tax=Didymella heteroderae TaxID=1769908 RepID=A0A9P4WU00_9PLEO|nr:hypothetical protein E8E12_006605 [Didymella heteroderae]
MFKRRSRSESPTKPQAAPARRTNDDHKTKRAETAAKLDRVLLWMSLHEGKLGQLEDHAYHAKASRRKGEKACEGLENRIVYVRDTLAQAQRDFHRAAREMDAWTKSTHEGSDRDGEARIEAGLEEAREKLRTLKYSDLIPAAE